MLKNLAAFAALILVSPAFGQGQAPAAPAQTEATTSQTPPKKAVRRTFGKKKAEAKKTAAPPGKTQKKGPSEAGTHVGNPKTPPPTKPVKALAPVKDPSPPAAPPKPEPKKELPTKVADPADGTDVGNPSGAKPEQGADLAEKLTAEVEPADTSTWKGWTGWTALGLGAAGMTTSLIIGSSTHDEMMDCRRLRDQDCFNDKQSLGQNMNTVFLVSTGLAAIGTTLVILEYTGGEDENSPTAAVLMMPNGIAGTFW